MNAEVESATRARREIVRDGVDVFSIRNGLVARKDTYLDWAAVQRQLAELAATPACRLTRARSVDLPDTRARQSGA